MHDDRNTLFDYFSATVTRTVVRRLVWRMHEIKLSSALWMWHDWMLCQREQEQKQHQLDRRTQVVVGRWRRNTVCSAFYGWKEGHVNRKEQRKRVVQVMARMKQMSLHRSWSSWVAVSHVWIVFVLCLNCVWFLILFDCVWSLNWR